MSDCAATILQESQFSLEKKRAVGHNRDTCQSIPTDRLPVAGGTLGDPP